MRGKKTTMSQVFEKIEQNLEVEKDHVDLEKLPFKIRFKDITQEEKIQEASKPLYLKRYE